MYDTMSILWVRPTKDSCSCNCWYARNYDSSFPMYGERVDTLYEVHIDCQVPVLCKNCLSNLYSAIGDIVNMLPDDADCYCD